MNEPRALRLVETLSPRAAAWMREKQVFGPLTRNNLIYDPNDAPRANHDWQPQSDNSWLANIAGAFIVVSANVIAFGVAIVGGIVLGVLALRDKLKK